MAGLDKNSDYHKKRYILSRRTVVSLLVRTLCNSSSETVFKYLCIYFFFLIFILNILTSAVTNCLYTTSLAVTVFNERVVHVTCKYVLSNDSR